MGALDTRGGSAPGRAGVLALVALFVGAFIVALTPVSDGDIFWHLAAGREMVHRRALLTTDPFTTSAAGRPWLDLHWLFQLGTWGIYRAVGLAGLVVSKALAVAIGAVVLAKATGRGAGAGVGTGSDTTTTTGVSMTFPEPSRPHHLGDVTSLELTCRAVGLLGALFLCRHLLLLRPVIGTLVMLSLFVAALEAARAGAARSLRWLPVLQLVWVNFQGLAVLGPLLIALYLVGAWTGRRAGDEATAATASGWLRLRLQSWPFDGEGALSPRALGLTLGLCGLALMANPHGWHALGLSGSLFLRVVPNAANVFSAQIAENVPPWVLYRIAPAETAHFGWYLAALAACLLLSRRRLPLSRWLVVLMFGALALMANRNLLLFYWLATPIAASALACRLRQVLARVTAGSGARGPGRLLGPSLGLLASLALGVQIAVAAIAQSREGSIASPVPFHFPTESCRYLQREGAWGSIFAPDHHGGYLALAAPALRPFIDTRLILHTAEEYAAYLRAVADPASFDALATTEGFRYVVLTTNFPDRYLGLAQHLAADPAWHLVFTDGAEVLFAREGRSLDLGERATTEAILTALAARFSGSADQAEAARLSLARLLVVLGEAREAQMVLGTLHSRAAAQLRARAYFAAGDRAAAESLARILVDADDRDLRSLTLLAQIAFDRGQPGDGVRWLRRALALDPYDPESRAVLDQVERSQAAGPADSWSHPLRN